MSGEQETRNPKLETRNWKLETRPGNPESPASSFQFPFSNFQFRISNFEFRFSSWLASAIAVFATFASTTLAYAQGCALCYNTASAVKAAGIAALRHGILILLIPPLAICLGVFYAGYRSRDHYNDLSELEADEHPELGSGLEHGQLVPPEESEARSQEPEVSIQESVCSR